MSKNMMLIFEALDYAGEFEKQLKEKEGIKLKPREKACLNRFIHRLYGEGWTINKFARRKG